VKTGLSRLFFALNLICATVFAWGNDIKYKCADEKLVNLVAENCALIKKITGNEAGCRGYEEILKVCAAATMSDEQSRKLRESVQKSNQAMRNSLENAEKSLETSQSDLSQEFETFKSTCQSSELNSALDEYVRYSGNYPAAIEYLKICRKDKSYADSLASGLRFGLRKSRFRKVKPPDFGPYIARCKDGDIRAAAEATLAELTVMKHRGVEPVLVSGGYAGLEEILFQLELNTKLENLEKLEHLKKWIISIQEVHARKSR